LTNKINLNPELELLDKLVFKEYGIELTNLETELESQEYFACNFKLNAHNVKFRVAKITPKKTGQFVSIWKRNKNGITEPFTIMDKFEWYIIATRQNLNVGFFIFPKHVLYANGILSDATKAGKRGIRVYPTWDQTTNKQAQKTQLWQSKFFLTFPPSTILTQKKQALY